MSRETPLGVLFWARVARGAFRICVHLSAVWRSFRGSLGALFSVFFSPMSRNFLIEDEKLHTLLFNKTSCGATKRPLIDVLGIKGMATYLRIL